MDSAAWKPETRDASQSTTEMSNRIHAFDVAASASFRQPQKQRLGMILVA